MKSAGELLEIELIELRRVDQKFLAAGFSQEWLALLHSEILIALGLENDIESVERLREQIDLRAIVRHVMGLKPEADEL
jgi:hypothetical protein